MSKKNKDEQELQQINSIGKIVIEQKKKVKTKDYANFFLEIETIEMIDKYVKKTGMKKSELVNTLLKEAFNMLEVK